MDAARLRPGEPGAALRTVYGQIGASGTSAGAPVPLYDFGEFSRLMGFEAVCAFEREWAEERPS